MLFFLQAKKWALTISSYSIGWLASQIKIGEITLKMGYLILHLKS